MTFDSSPIRYTAVSGDDRGDSIETEKDIYGPPQRRTSCMTWTSYALLLIALWSSSIFVAVKISSASVAHTDDSNGSDHHQTSPASASTTTNLAKAAPKLTCGTTSTEAQARGCVFDPLMASWIPQACPSYGREEFATVITQSNLSYYYEDENHQPTGELIDMAQFPHMDGIMYWGTVMEHLTHCAYTLKRIIYTQRTNARFDNITGNFSHTDHCVEFLISGLKSDPVNLTKELYRTDIPIGFLEC